MDIQTLVTIAVVAGAGLYMLSRLAGEIVEAAAIILALLNDLSDIGLLFAPIPVTGVMLDVAVAGLLFLAYKSPLAFIALADILPQVSRYPLATVALLLSYATAR